MCVVLGALGLKWIEERGLAPLELKGRSLGTQN